MENTDITLKGSEISLSDFYVDDILTGADPLEEAQDQ